MRDTHRNRGPRAVVIVLVVGLLAACSDGSADEGSATTTDPGAPATSTGPTSTGGSEPGGGSRPDECQPPPDGVAWEEQDSATLSQISAADGVEVYAAEYPLPGPTDGLWSQWGQGIALGDGRHLSAVGDHLGVDANSWFFVYDNADRSLTRFADVLSVVPHEAGTFGYGKVHAQMARDACGLVWAATYWGTRDDLVYGNGYEGDRLLSLDPEGRTIADHGPVAGERGMPTMTVTADGATLVATSVDAESDTAVFTIFDTIARQVTGQVDDPRQYGFRALGVDPVDGGVVYAIADGRLASLDPASGDFTDLDVTMPGYWLRAMTRPAPDGTIYGASDDETFLFSISPDGELTPYEDPGGTTTSLAMTPDGSRIFWMPEAHGSAWEVGARVMSMDTATGEVSEVTSLLDPFADELDLLPGGTYSMVYDDGRLILGVNASDFDDDSGFGTVVLVVIEGV